MRLQKQLVEVDIKIVLARWTSSISMLSSSGSVENKSKFMVIFKFFLSFLSFSRDQGFICNLVEQWVQL